ncbi:MAG TPA: MraY family glycosyltransferase [Elusimicrobiota bacterium]|nr:MraY family glycosyltransferase [Elusimicrobiota bacterium]
MHPTSLYLIALLMALFLSLALTPLMRFIAIRWEILDWPHSPVKTHVTPTPYLGGVAIFLSIVITLLLIRYFTRFQTGTLYALRGLIVGMVFMLGVGLVDDVVADGLSFRWKFFFQFLGAILLMLFGIRIKFIQPDWLSYLVTIVWVVGVTNSLNLMDIMDGLAASQALVASLAFLLISLPTEEIYVNFAATAVAGACLGFIPYNMSSKRKIFMGDAGSLLLGFSLAALSMGTSYTRVNEVGLFAPLLILGLPLYDTLFVMVMRIKQGKSPFLGSKDHLALKLNALGLSRKKVVLLLSSASALVSLCAFLVTRMDFDRSVFIVAGVVVVGMYAAIRLHDVRVS